MSQLVPIITGRAPALIAASGERATYRFFEFFTAHVRNPHMRLAYARVAVESIHVAAQDLCSGLRQYKKWHHVQTGAGHYGVFSGRRWTNEVYPKLRDFIEMAG